METSGNYVRCFTHTPKHSSLFWRGVGDEEKKGFITMLRLRCSGSGWRRRRRMKVREGFPRRPKHSGCWCRKKNFFFVTDAAAK